MSARNTVESNKALVQQWLQDEDQSTLATVAEVIDRWTTPDFTLHLPGVNSPLDRAGYRDLGRSFVTSFSDITHEIKELVAENELVSIRAILRMKHTGPYDGIAPTGRLIAVDLMVLVRIRDGKIAEEWFVLDSASLAQQLAPSNSAVVV